MNQGKRNKGLFKILGKITAFHIAIALILSIAVVGTVAFLIDVAGPIDNQFIPAEITTEVVETLDGTVKKNVSIKNTGDTTAWIRAAVIVTWQNEDGNVYGKVPKLGTDYEMTMNVVDSDGWIEGKDGFYYWYLPVKSVVEDADNCTTGVLIRECRYIANAPNGYFLNVEIIGSGIQSEPSSVYSNQWGSSSDIQIHDGKLVRNDG